MNKGVTILTKRRGKGEGSIFYREDRKRWIAQIKLDGGKFMTRSAQTQKAASEKLKKMQRELEQGLLVPRSQQTVKQFLEHWLEDVHKPPNVRINTYRIYRQYLDRHILPALGHVRLQQLSPEHIQELYARKVEEGYAAETVRGIHRMLHKALHDAVKWNRVASNVCDKVTQPRQVTYEIHPLTKEQAKALLEAAKGSNLEAILTLAVATGMRRGELLGLRWHDINFAEGSLVVRHTMDRAGKYGIIENDPKTEKSKRKIILPRFVLDTLMQHKVDQAKMREKAGLAWQERDIVFSNELGGFTEPTHLNRRFKNLLKKEGLPVIRFHDLRHSAATILLGMNVPGKVVQELLGHSTISTTIDRYSHVLPSMQWEMRDKLDDWFEQ
jgi:integrase